MEQLRKDIEFLHKSKYDIFERLCTYGSEKNIEDFIKEFNVDVNFNDGNFVEIICYRYDVKLLEMMIRHNADIHINKEYALYIYCENKYDDGIELLLSHGAIVEEMKYLCGYSYIHDFLRKKTHEK